MQEDIMKTDDMEIDILELFQVMLRKLWLIILCTAIGAVTMGSYAKANTTLSYSSSSTIYVLSQKISSVNLSLSAQLTSDFAILSMSRPVIENVIESLDLNYDYETVADMIAVSNPEGSQLLTFTVTHTDPVLARDVANAMADSVAQRISDVMKVDKPSIVEEAVIPKYSNGSGVELKILLGGIAGMAVAVAFILLFYLMDDTIHNEEDVKKYLNMNTLAALPMKGAEGRKKNLF